MSLIEYHGPSFERPTDNPRKVVLSGVALAVFFLGGICTWAALAPLARASHAEGVVVVEGSRRPVQHRDGGPVGTVLVKEGQQVKAGDVLVQLDLSDVRAEVEVLTTRRVQVMAQLARFAAEAADAEQIAFPPELEAKRGDPEVAKVLDQEERIFQAGRAAVAGRVGLLRQQIAGYQKQIDGLTGQVRETERQVDLIAEELVGLNQLLAKGLTPKSRVLALQRESASLGSTLEGLHAQIAAAGNEIHSAELEIDQIQKDRRQEISAGLSEAGAQLAEIEPRLVAAQDSLTRVDLTAPVGGRVLGLAVHGPGATILPGQVVLEIVPDTAPLVVKAKLNPNDVDQVRPGQPVDVHILAYKQRYQSILNGTVRSVSPDRIETPNGDTAWFEAVVTINPEDIERTKVDLVPGMAASSLIKTGERTVLQYFLDPILRVYDFAMKED
jgi:HlyD family type I secretion membrane fusion protein